MTPTSATAVALSLLLSTDTCRWARATAWEAELTSMSARATARFSSSVAAPGTGGTTAASAAWDAVRSACAAFRSLSAARTSASSAASSSGVGFGFAAWASASAFCAAASASVAVWTVLVLVVTSACAAALSCW